MISPQRASSPASRTISDSLLLHGPTCCPPTGRRFRKVQFVIPTAKLSTTLPLLRLSIISANYYSHLMCRKRVKRRIGGVQSSQKETDGRPRLTATANRGY